MLFKKKEFNFKTAREYEKAAIDFMKNKEGKDYMVWVRTYDINKVKKNDIFKVNTKTGILGIMDKNGNINTFHKNEQFLKNPELYLKVNKN